LRVSSYAPGATPVCKVSHSQKPQACYNPLHQEEKPMQINSFDQLLQFYRENLQDDNNYIKIFQASKDFAESLTVDLLRRWGSDLKIKSVRKLNKQQLIIAILQIQHLDDPDCDDGFAFFENRNS
jgi:hypothetical protein